MSGASDKPLFYLRPGSVAHRRIRATRCTHEIHAGRDGAQRRVRLRQGLEKATEFRLKRIFYGQPSILVIAHGTLCALGRCRPAGSIAKTTGIEPDIFTDEPQKARYLSRLKAGSTTTD
jgi:hypothetical protein